MRLARYSHEDAGADSEGHQRSGPHEPSLQSKEASSTQPCIPTGQQRLATEKKRHYSAVVQAPYQELSQSHLSCRATRARMNANALQRTSRFGTSGA